MTLKCNDWMKYDLNNGMYHVVYVESSDVWWILYSTDDYMTALRELENQRQEGGNGVYHIVDYNGKAV